MRLSTAGMHRTSINAILEHQVQAREDAEPGHHRQEIPDRVRGSDRRRPRRGPGTQTRGQRAIRAQFKHHREPPQLRGTDAGGHHLGAAERARLGPGRRERHARPGRAQDDRQPGAAESRGPHGHGQPPGWQRRVPVRRHVDRDPAVRAGRDRRQLPGRPDDAADPHQQHAIAGRCACRRGRLHGHCRAQRRVPHDGFGDQHRQCDHRRGHGDGPHRLGRRTTTRCNSPAPPTGRWSTTARRRPW